MLDFDRLCRLQGGVRIYGPSESAANRLMVATMEAKLIAELRRRIPRHPLVELGPGDDAAVLRLAELDACVMTTDLLTDTVDFRLGEVGARRVGRKALAVNLSDLAAMAARPLAAVVALALPRHNGLELALELYAGMAPLAERAAHPGDQAVPIQENSYPTVE